MSDDVKDFAYYAGAAERVIATVEDGMPAVEVAAIAAIAQVFATLAAGAPEPAAQKMEIHQADCPCLPR